MSVKLWTGGRVYLFVADQVLNEYALQLEDITVC